MQEDQKTDFSVISVTQSEKFQFSLISKDIRHKIEDEKIRKADSVFLLNFCFEKNQTEIF